MSERGGRTPSIGIPYMGATDPARVHEDNERAYRVIDAEIGQIKAALVDPGELIIRYEGDGEYGAYDRYGSPVDVEPDGDGGYVIRQQARKEG